MCSPQKELLPALIPRLQWMSELLDWEDTYLAVTDMLVFVRPGRPDFEAQLNRCQCVGAMSSGLVWGAAGQRRRGCQGMVLIGWGHPTDLPQAADLQYKRRPPECDSGPFQKSHVSGNAGAPIHHLVWVIVTNVELNSAPPYNLEGALFLLGACDNYTYSLRESNASCHTPWLPHMQLVCLSKNASPLSPLCEEI